jgi:hypothetical protein
MAMITVVVSVVGVVRRRSSLWGESGVDIGVVVVVVVAAATTALAGLSKKPVNKPCFLPLLLFLLLRDDDS